MLELPPLVEAGERFLERAECRCSDARVWDARAGACVPCPAASGVMCSPFVQSPVHALEPGLYPMLPDGSVARTGDQLLRDATFIRCHRPGVCDGNSDANRWNASGGAHRLPGAARFTFECRGGRDPSSRLCSRCASGRWSHGASCLACPGASVAWLLPAAMLLSAAAVAAAVWRRSASAVRWSGEVRADALSVFVLWLQLLVLLRSYAASATVASATPVGGGRGAGGGAAGEGGGDRAGLAGGAWSAVQQAVAALSLPAAWDVSALRCVAQGFGFAARQIFTMAVPPVVLSLAAAAAATPHASALKRRLWYCIAFVANATVLPVFTAALSVWRCTSPGGLAAYLVAAPDVKCGSAEHNVLRAVAAAALGLYLVPMVARATAVLARGGAGDGSSAGGGGVAGEMVKPLLEMEDEAARGGAAASAERLAVTVVLLRSLRNGGRRPWVWPLADLLRSMALAAVVGLLDPGSAAVPSAIVIVLTVSMAAVAFGQPRGSRDNALLVTALASAMTVFLISAFETYAANPDGSSSTPFASGCLAVIVSAVTLVLVCAAVNDFRRSRGGF